MLKKISSICFLALASVGFFGSLSSVNAQFTYTSPAPDPLPVGESDRSPESLAEDSESLIMGSWDFSYSITPDNNLFVTRIFVAILNQDSIGMASQVDCGRAAYRFITVPYFYRNQEMPGTPISDISINTWEYFNKNEALGRAMMRTCESAARAEGIDWIWE
ncbi:hypothetical protein H6F75_27185 [Nodosilinea sp. FACHB-131]|uniref:hypothetical protein n=1 Tax=Cyanophyceae TaxID=3028117 RepID=UPI001685F027|nr:hypothetical protein [Nodosilinea sp. FACHB-131]MBD1877172.1 hypothetical protein [Nodosilinea sp. FACHB-131]